MTLVILMILVECMIHGYTEDNNILYTGTCACTYTDNPARTHILFEAEKNVNTSTLNKSHATFVSSYTNPCDKFGFHSVKQSKNASFSFYTQ